MAENSKIEWTHHTFNPWTGCTKVSAGCKNCYAEKQYSTVIRGIKWGPQGLRVIKANSGWREPLKWNRQAEEAGERRRVFCASLADVFEGEDTMPAESWPAVEAARARLFDLIHQTPSLDWLLLTKRPENIMKTVFRLYDSNRVVFGARPMLHDWWSRKKPPGNVWLGTSVEDQEAAEKRIPHLLRCPAVVRFLSCEPLIGPLQLDLPRCEIHGRDYVQDNEDYGEICGECAADDSTGEMPHGMWLDPCADATQEGINWVIVGGESGANARPMNVEWVRGIVEDCKGVGVPVLVKQLGAQPVAEYGHDYTNRICQTEFEGSGYVVEHKEWPKGPDEPLGSRPRIRSDGLALLSDRKGGDMSEWPEDLRVREFPTPASST